MSDPVPAPALITAPIGTRVVVRHLIEGGERATDSLGELVARDGISLTVQTRRGRVRIPLADIVVGKPVPPADARWRVASFLQRARVAVLDLDGVIRTHDAGGATATAERELGLPAGALLELAFSLPEATAMVLGKTPYADWSAAVLARLLADGHEERTVRTVVETWTSDHGTPTPRTVELVDGLLASGIPVFVFTNGSDRVPSELKTIGLGRLVPHLLNTHDLGFAKPAPEAYAVAHAEIERRLGRTVGRGEVHFTDDRPANVDAARHFGWQARVFTLP